MSRGKFQKAFDAEVRKRAEMLDINEKQIRIEQKRCEVAMLDAEWRLAKLSLDRMEMDLESMKKLCKASAKD